MLVNYISYFHVFCIIRYNFVSDSDYRQNCYEDNPDLFFSCIWFVQLSHPPRAPGRGQAQQGEEHPLSPLSQDVFQKGAGVYQRVFLFTPVSGFRIRIFLGLRDPDPLPLVKIKFNTKF